MCSKHNLESIQGIRKRPTYRFEDTIVWERFLFISGGISEDLKSILITVWYSTSEVFVHLPCSSSNLVYRSLESTLSKTSIFLWLVLYSQGSQLVSAQLWSRKWFISILSFFHIFICFGLYLWGYLGNFCQMLYLTNLQFYLAGHDLVSQLICSCTL